MRNIIEFNESYFVAIQAGAVNDIKDTAISLNVGLSQIQEILKMSSASVRGISNATVAIAEPMFSSHDLHKIVDVGNDDVITSLNQNYLTMIRHLSATNERLVHLATRIPLDMTRKIRSLSSREIKHAAGSNKLMFKLGLSARSISRANTSGGFRKNDNFLNSMALMSFTFNGV
jgi:hypothetical protein